MDYRVAKAFRDLYESIHESVRKTLYPKRTYAEIQAIGDQIFGIYSRVILANREERQKVVEDLLRRYGVER